MRGSKQGMASSTMRSMSSRGARVQRVEPRLALGELAERAVFVQSGHNLFHIGGVFFREQVPDDEQRLAIPGVRGQGDALVIEKDFGGSGEVSRKIGVEFLLLEQGDGAPLLLQAIYLARELPIQLVKRGAAPQVVGVLQARVYLVEHVSDARKRESQRCEALDAQQAREIPCTVVAVAALAARRLGQEPDGVVMPQRAHRHPRQLRYLARLHQELSFAPAYRARRTIRRSSMGKASMLRRSTVSKPKWPYSCSSRSV